MRPMVDLQRPGGRGDRQVEPDESGAVLGRGMQAARFRLFVYGTFLVGEPEHGVIAGAEPLGPMRTAPGYTLVELQGLAALVEGGAGDVAGELYLVDYDTLSACD